MGPSSGLYALANEATESASRDPKERLREEFTRVQTERNAARAEASTAWNQLSALGKRAERYAFLCGLFLGSATMLTAGWLLLVFLK